LFSATPSSKFQIPAEHLALRGWVTFVDPPRLGISRDCSRHGDERPLGDVDAVADGGINTEKGIGLHHAMTRQDNVGCERDMILDRAVMPNVVTTPKDDVVSNGRERLNGIIFQEEGIVSNLRAGYDSSLGNSGATE